MAIFTVKDYSKQLEAEIDKKLILGLKAVGQEIEGKAKKNCPVDTGRLRNSITNEVEEEELAVYVGSNVEYAPYVELLDYRHKTGKAHFLRDACQDNIGRYQQILQAALNS